MLAVMGVLGVAVLFGLIVTLGEANRQRDRAIRLQSHSYDIMVLARTLGGTIAQSEASLGRFVISGDKQLGRLYYDDWQFAGKQIDRLGTLTRQNDSQAKRMDELRRAYDERGKELSLIALNTNYGKNSQALSLYYRAREAPSLAAINRALEEITRSERDLLDQRTRETRAAIERSAKLARILSAFGILILLGAITLGALTVRALTERGVAQAEAAAQRERADGFAAAVAVATAELRDQEARLRQVQKMEAVGQLTGGIAHDFNNMLAVVMGGLELAQRGLADASANAESRRHIDSAMEGAKRAAALTGQLLTFARETAINPEVMAVDDLLRGMSELLDRTLGDAITVTIHDRSAGWRLRADRVQLENSLVNLAVNARDAMLSRNPHGGGTLTIRTRAVSVAEVRARGSDIMPAADYTALEISDTGTGIPPEVLPKIFEPFFTTKEVGKGTGLGLSTVYGIVKQSGGYIFADSKPGQGATFTIYLPVHNSGTVAPVRAAPRPRQADLWGTGTVLLVEDEAMVRAVAERALSRQGYTVLSAENGEVALELLETCQAPDLLISDVVMPTMDGPTMARHARERYPQLPILFMSGYAEEQLRRSIDLENVSFLPKPFSVQQLAEAARDALTQA